MPDLGINHREKQQLCCSIYQFTDNVLLDHTQRTTGSEFGESKGQQGSVALFPCVKYHCPTADSHCRAPAPCPCPGTSADLAAIHTTHPPEEPIKTLCSSQSTATPATAGFLPSMSWAGSQLAGSWLQDWVHGLLGSPPFSPSCLFLVDHLYILQCAGVPLYWAGDPLLSHSWITCWSPSGERPRGFLTLPFLYIWLLNNIGLQV